jgi:hypothetical protein
MRVLNILNLNLESSTTMKKSTRKGQASKLQVIGKRQREMVLAQPLLAAHPKAALPLLDLIERSQLSIEGLFGPCIAAIYRTTAADGCRIGCWGEASRTDAGDRPRCSRLVAPHPLRLHPRQAHDFRQLPHLPQHLRQVDAVPHVEREGERGIFVVG